MRDRLGVVLESITDGFCTFDLQGRFTYLNPEAERLLGQTCSSLLGQVIWDAFPESSASSLGRALSCAMADGKQATMTVHNVLLGRWFDVRICPSSAGLAVYFRDVDDRHGMAMALERERARLVAAQSVAKIGSWEIDLTRGTVDWSDETFRIFETDRSRFTPTRAGFHALVHPADLEAVDRAFLRSLERGCDGTQRMEHRLLLPGGVERTVEERWTVTRDDAGVAVGALGTCQDISERKRAEQELLQSHAQMSMVCRLARVGAWSVDASNNVSWSDEVFGIHEVPPRHAPTLEEAIAFYAPEWRDTIRRAALACFSSAKPFDLELEIVTARSRRVWVRAIGEAVQDQSGAVRSIRGALQDLSERKQAEEEARKITTRLTNTLERLTIGFYTLDADWRFTYINGEAEAMLGRPRTQLMGRVLWDEFSLADGSELAGSLRRALRGGETALLEARHFPSDTWCRVGIYPAEGGLAVYYRDISKERSERAQLELLEASVARLNDMVVITETAPLDEPGPRIVFVNDAFLRASGRARDAVLGTSPRFLQGPLTDRGELDRIRKALGRYEPVHAELINYTATGERYWVEMDIVPISIDGTGFTHFVSIQRDITDRKRDQDALRELNGQLEARVRARTAELAIARDAAEEGSRAKSAFLAAMSHEIRTPMNGVIGMIEVLQQTSLRDYQVEMVDLIRDSAFSLLRIIEDILDLSKIEAGKLSIECEPMNLADAVEKVGGMCDHMAANRGVLLSVFVDPELACKTLGDETRLRQVMVNLVGNAIKFSSGRAEPGRVALRVRLAERLPGAMAVEMVVSDNGIGMDDATQSRLFTPFNQADASTTRRFGGTGLGLAISAMLVKLMGGTISVASAPDQGATFTVRLRLATLADGDAAAADTSLVAGLNCLVVGDEAPLAEDVAAYLLAGGAMVDRSPSLESALAMPRAPGACVWVILPDQPVHSAAELRARIGPAHAAQTHFVSLARGQRSRPRIGPGDLVSVDMNASLRKTLPKAVALASGRSTAVSDASDHDIQEGRASAPPSHVARRHDRLILVAEDNETNRKVIAHQLNLIGFPAEVAADGLRALEKWRAGDFAIVITDLHMPEMDGYTLASIIRAEDPPGRRTPIIALTANVLKDEESRCRACGMDAYLSKPVSMQLLRAAMEQCLGIAQLAGIGHDASSVASRGESVVDLHALVELIGDDRDQIAEVLETFRRGALQASKVLHDAVVAGSVQVVADTTHKLKSGARTIGAMRLGQICAEIEQLAATGRVDAIAAALPSCQAEMDAVLGFLEDRRRAQSRSGTLADLAACATADAGSPGSQEP